MNTIDNDDDDDDDYANDDDDDSQWLATRGMTCNESYVSLQANRVALYHNGEI